jgi:hypothetical protein
MIHTPCPLKRERRFVFQIINELLKTRKTPITPFGLTGCLAGV